VTGTSGAALQTLRNLSNPSSLLDEGLGRILVDLDEA
jgi:hypothetical protein